MTKINNEVITAEEDKITYQNCILCTRNIIIIEVLS